jgi:hypothetical protein
MKKPDRAIPVAVIMGRREISGGAWRVPSWRAVGVVSGEHFVNRAARGEPVAAAGEEQQFLWTGLTLELYRDAAESYWSNLVGEKPALFVRCQEDADMLPIPVAVSADQDEAGAGIEGDDSVFAVAIPPEVYQALERFVVEHFVPREPKKRKRKNWSSQDDR